MNDSASKPVPPGGPDSALVARQLLHELQVHQAELTQQNEDLRLARSELELSLGRRQALFEFAPIALLSLDAEGRLVELNRRAAELLGAGAQPGARLLLLVNDQSRAALAGVLSGATEGAEVVCLTQADDGSVRTAEVQVCRPHPPVDAPLVALAESTERHRAEGARLAQLTAEAASRQKSAFLARMSHELRTPLNAVLGFAHLLAADPAVQAAGTPAGWVARIQEAGMHQLRLVDDLLDLARLEAGVMRTLREEFDLVRLVEEVASMLAPLAALRPVTLRMPGNAAAAWVKADRTRSRQVLINLVSNAIKYNREGGEVRLGVTAREGLVSVAVSDDGPGLTVSQQAGLFVPFERLGAEHGTVAGAGLGLAISRHLVEAMQGRLELRTAPGQGCTFTMTLPGASGRPSDAAPAAAAAGAVLAPARVLYVEDNEVNIEVMQALLRDQPNLQLLVARDGHAGLALVREHHPDLVLLDMQLPDMHGLEFFARLRAEPAVGKVPCVAVSANAMADDVRAALEAGLYGYLTKPIDAEALIASIHRHRPTGRPGAPSPA